MKLNQIWKKINYPGDVCNQSCFNFFSFYKRKKKIRQNLIFFIFFHFFLDFFLSATFLTKNNDFLTRLKITWVDRQVPTIILIYGNLFWTLFGSLGPLKPVSCLSAGLAAEPSTIPCENLCGGMIICAYTEADHTRKFSPPTGGFFLAPAEG